MAYMPGALLSERTQKGQPGSAGGVRAGRAYVELNIERGNL